MGRERAAALYSYYDANECPAPSDVYCDALIHCQLVNFENMTRNEKLDFILAAAYEIIGVEDIEEYPAAHEADEDLYNKAVERLNTENTNRFPARQEFYEAMDESFDPSKPMYHDDFDQFLNDTYGVYLDLFETGEFIW